MNNNKRKKIFNIYIHQVTENDALKKIINWALRNVSASIYFANSHTIFESNRNLEICNIINRADLTLPDGFPVALAAQEFKFKKVKRISGPDFMVKLCKEAEKEALSLFLYGSDSVTLEKIKENLTRKFKNLKFAGSISPPYGKMAREEIDRHVDAIKNSKADIVFVGLGFPKQEMWIDQNKNLIPGVMLGVGAAFDFIAKTKKRAPKWIQSIGLEWFWRFIQEPRRLGKRYFLSNSYLVLKTIEIVLKKVVKTIKT